MKKIFLAATFDTKAVEANYIKDLLLKDNLAVITVDLSTSTNNHISDADIANNVVANFYAKGADLVFTNDRGSSISFMTEAFINFIKSRNDIGAIIGIGGSGGTAIITKAMQALPIGIPKLMLSTMTSGNISNYVGISDICMMNSVTDFVGINFISAKILATAAGLISGAFLQSLKPSSFINTKPSVGITMFGVTTPCVEQISAQINSKYDPLVFHATGVGGRSMEKLLDDGLLYAVIDITTTEVCDFLFGGVLACGEDRFDAIKRSKKPAIISCGALDMINFASYESVPSQYKSRLLYKHNSEVTLMRTNVSENIKVGEWIAHKLNQCVGEIRFIFPEGGVSALDAKGQPFWDPSARLALFAAIENNLQLTKSRKIIKTPYHINSPEFANIVVREFNEITSLNEEKACLSSIN
jgi:uncharacterized protein (UPF0261 family)